MSLSQELESIGLCIGGKFLLRKVKARVTSYFASKNLANIYLFKEVVETLEKRAKYGVNNFVLVSLIITWNM